MGDFPRLKMLLNHHKFVSNAAQGHQYLYKKNFLESNMYVVESPVPSVNI